MKQVCAAAAFLALILVTGTGAASAATPAPANSATDLSGVDVVAPPPIDPKVVSAFPADGGAVAGGLVILRVTFDQPMTADAWAFAKSDKGEFPNCLARPRLLNDKRSFALLCTVKRNQAYAMEINAAPGFVSAAGRAAAPYVMRFTTDDGVTSALHEALIKAGLTDNDAPLMDWKGISGVSNSPPRLDDTRTP